MNEGEKIRIVLVDDHDIIRQGLTTLLQAEPDLSIIGEACNGEQAVEVILKLLPDVAIVNFNMPKGDGIEVIRRVRQSTREVRLAVFTASANLMCIDWAFRAGASAYVPKQSTPRQLIDAIHTIMDGGVYISPACVVAAEAERGRIAHELHDTVGQALTGIRLNLELVERDLDSANEKALARLNHAKDLVSLAFDQIRCVSHRPNPPDRSDVNQVRGIGL